MSWSTMQVERNNGKQSIISMKELIKAKNINDDDSKQIGKWTNAFILTTSRRSYELRSYFLMNSLIEILVQLFLIKLKYP